MRRGFTPPCMTSRDHTTAQVRGAAEDRVARRREVARSAVSGKSLARGPLRELELDRAGTRAPAPGLADGCDRGRGQRAIRVGHPGPPGGRALSDLRHGWPAAASTGRSAGRPRNSIRARTTRRARVRPRTTLPVGRPQNTRARQARVTAPMRRAPLVAPHPDPDRPGAQAGVLGAALQPGDRAGQALAGAYRGDRPAGEERPGSDHQRQHQDGAQPQAHEPHDGVVGHRGRVMGQHRGGDGVQVDGRDTASPSASTTMAMAMPRAAPTRARR